MAQNTSSAVMQQRHAPKDSLDDYPTPPWATRALLKVLTRFEGPGSWRHLIAREPAANRGYMAKVLAEQFGRVLASDVRDYGVGFPVDDYLLPGRIGEVDWTITNPPFRLAEPFIARAIETSRRGVAMLVRTSFIEGAERYRQIFGRPERLPSMVLQFTERVVMQQGKMLDPDVAVPTKNKQGQMVMRKPSTATSYCWVIWASPRRLANVSCTLEWTGICRKALTRPGDYDEAGDA